MAFDGFIALDPAARDGGSQLVGDPDTGDMAAAWWTGHFWSEIQPNGRGEIDRDRRVQIDFEPTHYKPVLAKAA